MSIARSRSMPSMNSRPSTTCGCGPWPWRGRIASLRRAAEPEQAERRLDERVLRDARVGGVGMLVRPVGAVRAVRLRGPAASCRRPASSDALVSKPQARASEFLSTCVAGRSASRRRRQMAAGWRTAWRRMSRAARVVRQQFGTIARLARYGGRFDLRRISRRAPSRGRLPMPAARSCRAKATRLRGVRLDHDDSQLGSAGPARCDQSAVEPTPNRTQ